MADCFISYARHDGKDLASQLHGALEDRRKDAWVDLHDIPPASRWEEDLKEGVAKSDAFVFVMTPASVASQECAKELEHAEQRNKRIIPVKAGEVDDASVPKSVRALNWIPAEGLFQDDFERSFGDLVTAIETDLPWVRQHTHWGNRATEWEAKDRDQSLLLRGSELAEAEQWLGQSAGKDPQPTPLHTELVLASRQASTRRQRRTLLGVAVALAVAVSLAVVALVQRNDAIAQRNSALSRDLAASSVGTLQIDPELSLLLAIRAAQTSDTPQAEDALGRALAESQVRADLRGQKGGVRSAVFSRDGRSLLTAGDDGSARIWDLASRRARVLRTPASSLEATFSPDGKTVLTAGNDEFLRRWNSASGVQLGSAGRQPFDMSYTAFSRDGTLLATKDYKGTSAWVWDLTSDRKVMLEGHAAEFNGLAISPDDRLVAAGGDDGLVRIWDAVSGRMKKPALRGHKGPAYATAFSPDGKSLVSGGRDTTARVWDVAGRRERGNPLLGHTEAVYSVAFSPDGKSVAAGGNDNTVRIWNVRSGNQVTALLGHTGNVLTAAYSHDGTQLVTGGSDASARVWDTELGAQIALPGRSGRSHRAILSPDGAAVLVANTHGSAQVWNLAKGGPPIHLEDNLGNLLRGAFSRDGRSVATASSDGRVVVWDLASGSRKGPPLPGPAGGADAVDLSPDGRSVVTAERFKGISNFNAVVQVWDVATGKPKGAPMRGHIGAVYTVGFSADGRSVITGGSDRSARLWDAATGQPKGPPLLGHTGPVYDAAWSPDSRSVVTASGDTTARLWDARSGALLHTLSGHAGPVHSAGFSPDGRSVLTSSDDRTVRAWDAVKGIPLDIVRGPTGPALAAFTPDSRSLVSDLSGSLRRYPCQVCGDTLGQLLALARQRATRTLTPQERAEYLHS